MRRGNDTERFETTSHVTLSFGVDPLHFPGTSAFRFLKDVLPVGRLGAMVSHKVVLVKRNFFFVL
jgi:hypothetical protein